MNIAFTLIFFLFGLIFGSFYNVVGLRLPKNIPFVNGRSACPQCQMQLSWYENIPLLSFLLQVGKCRHCAREISVVYPLIEFITGFLFAWSYILLGIQAELFTALLLVSMLMIVFVADINYMLIPNKVLLFFLPIFIIMRVIEPLDPWWSPIAGALVGFLSLLLIILISKGGMGAGDMKLFGVLGIVLGVKFIMMSFFISCLLGAITGVGLMATKRVSHRQPVPFGPYIVAASMITYFYGESLLNWYLKLL